MHCASRSGVGSGWEHDAASTFRLTAEAACSLAWISTTRRRFSISWTKTIVLADVNVLVYAFRRDSPDHEAYRAWLLENVGADAAFGVSDIVLSGFVRVVTNPRAFVHPSKADRAFEFASMLREQPNAVLVSPGTRHWDIFANLCRAAGAKGNLVGDAYLAALAIESGSEWITADRDYSRFPGLRWRHPLVA